MSDKSIAHPATVSPVPRASGDKLLGDEQLSVEYYREICDTGTLFFLEPRTEFAAQAHPVFELQTMPHIRLNLLNTKRLY